ncbi:MAG: pantothenate kinase, partial [Candidatus Korarchaeota archaeon]|nr:pantothenate kinase [Candidatus Korarchaeota archaeon]
MLIIGLDMGGTTTKGVLVSESGILAKTVVVASDPLAAAAGAMGKLVSDQGIEISDVEAIALSGGKMKP